MAKEKTPLHIAAKDMVVGYGIIVLGMLCFFVALWALIALVRILIGS